MKNILDKILYGKSKCTIYVQYFFPKKFFTENQNAQFMFNNFFPQKFCTENQNTQFMFNNFFSPKILYGKSKYTIYVQ